MNNKTAIIMGCGGQDGFYLSNLLLSKNFKVYGAVRRSSQPRDYLLPLIQRGLEIIECDISDSHSVNEIIKKYKPNLCFNLAAMSHVHSSFNSPHATFEINTIGVLNVLEAIKNFSKETRLYQASTSEMYGANYSLANLDNSISHFNIKQTNPKELLEDKLSGWYGQPFQDEETPLDCQSPYSASKIAAHQLIKLYRESYNLFACAGVLFNHESERRGEMFVTRKITKYVGQLKVAMDFEKNENSMFSTSRLSDLPKLKLGNLSACRDWSHAEDMVTAMVMMLEADTPDDYVVGSGETYSVEQFVEAAFNVIGKNWKDYVEIDQSLMRPAEVDYLRSNPSKIKNALGWEPKLDFNGLVKRMVDFDIKRAEQKMKMYGSVC